MSYQNRCLNPSCVNYDSSLPQNFVNCGGCSYLFAESNSRLRIYKNFPLIIASVSLVSVIIIVGVIIYVSMHPKKAPAVVQQPIVQTTKVVEETKPVVTKPEPKPNPAFANIKLEELTPSSFPTWVNQSGKNKYLSLLGTKNYKMSTYIKFKSGNTELEGQSLDDIIRVAAYISQSNFKDFRVYIVGFSDTIGDYSYNLKLSEMRANYVKDQILSRSSAVSGRTDAIGFGQEQPIDTNNTPEGRLLNRRVEIWLIKK